MQHLKISVLVIPKNFKNINKNYKFSIVFFSKLSQNGCKWKFIRVIILQLFLVVHQNLGDTKLYYEVM